MAIKTIPKISIIIPIYNVDKYLHQTLFSVTNQTLKNIEIICVEDCSTDTSSEILKKFAEVDDRIHVIQHDVNKGVSIARKEAVLASTGEYIMFLDGDDFLDTTACKQLYQLIRRENVDILQFGTTIVPQGNVKEDEILYLEKILTPYNEKIIINFNGELNHHCFVENIFGFTLWNKIYCGDIVRQATTYYPTERFNLAEDLYMFFLIAFFSKSYSSTTKKYYFYNFGAGITGGTVVTEKAFANKIAQGKILEYIKAFVEEFDPAEITADSVESIKNIFISDVIYNLLYNGYVTDCSKVMYKLLGAFPKEDVLSELLEKYYDGDSNTKKVILRLCTESFLLNKTHRNIKTIGTFYYRIDNGGIERVISKLIPIWIEAGYRVVLFTEEIPSVNDYEYPKEVVRIIVPKIKSKNKESYQHRIKYWQDMVSKYEIDTMVYHAWISEYLLLDMLAFKSMNKSFIIHTHSFFAQGMRSPVAGDAQHSIMINDIYKICDAVITLTDADYNWWSLMHDHVYKTVNPVPYDFTNIACSELNSRNILWVGRISPEKKPEEALKILKLIIEHGCEAELHFVGKAEDESYYQVFLNTINELNLKEYVKLHGFQSNVEFFYNKASVYLCTSEFEGFSMTLIESKIHGLPAVIYDLPNLDLVQNPKGLKVVEQNDALAAATYIIELLENKAIRKQIGLEARKSVEDFYSIDILALWKNIFGEIVSNKSNLVEEKNESLVTAVNMFLDFSLKGIDARERERIYWFFNGGSGTIDIESQKRLDEIYNMRTWKLIQKYRKFMDETWLGKILSKIRDALRH